MRRLLSILLLVITLASCKNGHVIDINSFRLPAKDVFSFGSKGDIILPGLPDTVVEISFVPGANELHWKMRHPVYLKVEGKTINRVNIDTITSISIYEYSITKQQLLDCTTKFNGKKDNVRYVGLKDIFTYYHPSSNIPTNSLFACDTKDNIIILLDTVTRIRTIAEREISWQNSGTIPGTKAELSFMKTLRFTPVNFTNTDNFFSKNDTSFISRVKPLHNSFGADKISLELKDESTAVPQWEVHFNKKYRFVFPNEMFTDTSAGNYYICQELAGYKQGKYIYTDNFSAGFPDILGKVDSTHRFIPAEGVSINYNYYNSGTSLQFVLRYSPLLLIFIAGLILYFCFFRSDSDTDNFFYEINSSEVRNWRNYYIVITVCLFILLTIREFIGYNLSFSYPYFPFSYSVAATVAPLILLSVLLTYLLFWKYNFRNTFTNSFRIIVAVASLLLLLYNAWLSRELYTDALNDVKQNGIKGLQSYHAGVLLITIYALGAITLFSGLLFFIENLFSVVIYKGNKFSINIGQLAGIILLSILAALFFQQDNAASGFIIPWMLMVHAGLRKSKWLSDLKFQKNIGSRILWYLVRILIIFGLPAFILLFVKKDMGYFITLPLFLLIYWLFTSILYKYYENPKTAESKRLRWNMFGGSALVILVIVGLFFLFSKISASYTPGDSERFNARVTAMYNFESIQEYGYNETEQIAQFFSVMGMYGIPQEHNTFEPIHRSVSSFTDPVVKNDLSVLYGLIYSSGKWWWAGIVVLLIVLFLMLWQGIKMAVFPGGVGENNYEYFLTGYGELRLLSVCVVCGTALWLLLSYYGLLPFTGRLLYGLGQDSLGEVIETTAWFSIMGLVGNLSFKKLK